MIAHGTAATLHDGRVRLLPSAPALALWVGLVAQRTPTRTAVARVHAYAAAHPEAFGALLERASAASAAAIEAYVCGDHAELGRRMHEGHTLLREVGVSTPALDALVVAAQEAGAWGAKLTGGGLGGAMIALAPQDADLGPALRRAGAVEVIAP